MKREELENRLKEVKSEIKDFKIMGIDETYNEYKGLKKERKQLKKQLEELPKLEVGKWYKFDLSLMFVKNKPTNNNVIGYGFDGTGLWTDKYHYWESYKDNYRPATDKEVQTALIEEAKKIGFKEGVTANCFNNFKSQSDIGFKFISIDNGLLFQNQCIFLNGKWATIIKQKKVSISGDFTKEDLEKIIQTEFK